MDWIQIELIILVVFISLFIISVYKWIKNNRSDLAMVGSWITGCGMVVMIIIVSVGSVAWYNTAISLPYDYEAECSTVAETETLLMKYENISADMLQSLGYGLEAMELKLQLKQSIQAKNKLKAELSSWLNNPLMPFKNIIIERLPPGNYGRITIT